MFGFDDVGVVVICLTELLFIDYWCSHFIVPELGPEVKFTYASHKAVEEYKEAKAVSISMCVNIKAFCIFWHIIEKHCNDIIFRSGSKLERSYRNEWVSILLFGAYFLFCAQASTWPYVLLLVVVSARCPVWGIMINA